jgi:hypothetical protein
MPEYILLMHDDGDADAEEDWEPYLARLRARGCFEGGSAIGDGLCVRKSGPTPAVTGHLVGYIRLNASNLDEAKSLVAGNPHFDAGGTVEIRELPRTS